MCGIAGIIRFDGAPICDEDVRRLTGGLAHRGPDGDGMMVFPSLALGHCRLSIIDIAGGGQPMSNEDGTVWVSYNGEIYNFRLLRERLEARGHRFRTSSDTEVLVHGWEEWGSGLLGQLRGMFAFAIADRRRGRLLLARDRFGIKPLVYAASPKFLAFASEIAPLANLLGRQHSVDPDALNQYLALGYVPAPTTIFKEIRKLPPGHLLETGFDGADLHVSRYWRLGYWQSNVSTRPDAVEECRQVLDESVRAHLVADVPFGAFLSGGVDSSLIVAMMAKHVGQVHTFSIGFENAGCNELPYARMVANRYGTVHHEEYVTASVARLLPDLVRHYGEPFADSSAVPTYYVSRLARAHVPMVLSGDGGDELFGGYGRYRWFRSWLGAASRQKPLWKRAARGVLRQAFPRRFPPIRSRPDAKTFDWPAFMPCIGAGLREFLVRQELARCGSPAIEAFADAAACIEDGNDPRAAQWMDFHTYMPGDVLTKVDIGSMMTGLEVRTPLLDPEVADFAVRLPMQWGIGDGDRYAGKRVLRTLLAREMGDEFATRPKAGFVVPMKDWFAVGSELDCLFRDTVLARDARSVEWLRTEALRDLHAKHVAGEDQSAPLWAVLVLETWMREFGA